MHIDLYQSDSGSDYLNPSKGFCGLSNGGLRVLRTPCFRQVQPGSELISDYRTFCDRLNTPSNIWRSRCPDNAISLSYFIVIYSRLCLHLQLLYATCGCRTTFVSMDLDVWHTQSCGESIPQGNQHVWALHRDHSYVLPLEERDCNLWYVA